MGCAFRVSGIEPRHDLAWLTAGEDVHRLFWQAVVKFVLEVKDQELAAGLDRFGRPLAPIAESTRKKGRWRSHTGMGSASAPPLSPAYRLSRTRSLFTGRAHKDHAEFFWRRDEVTGLPWGKVLGWHRAGAGRLPVRDVIGLSLASLAKVKAKADQWWAAWKAGKAAEERARTFQVATAGPPTRIVATGRTDLHNATFGIAGDQARSRRAIDAGMATGFRQLPPKPKPPAVGTPAPIPAPAPKPKPVAPRMAAMKPAPPPKARPPKPAPPPKARPKPLPPPVQVIPAPKPKGELIPPKPKGLIPDIPERKRYVKEVIEEQEAGLDDIATQLGTTPGAILGGNRPRLQAAIDRGEFYVRADSGTLKKILAEGRFKSQFETNTSSGTLDHAERAGAEADQFGVDPKTRPASRPIYGYLSAPGFGSTYTGLEARLETYGDAAIRLKPHVRERATVTVGDSLNVMGRAYASPAKDADPRSIPWSGLNMATFTERLQKAAGPDEYLEVLQSRHGYIEAQYQGGLSADDIDEVAFTFKPSPTFLAQLEARGIRWRVIARRDDD